MEKPKKYDPVYRDIDGKFKAEMEEDQNGEWVSEESYNRACEAINGMAMRIETLHKTLVDIATMFENQPEGASMGSYFQVAYDMRSIARTALTPKP